MLKNYAKELTAIAAIFGFISWGIYVCVAAPKPKEVLTATRGHEAEAPKAAPAPAPKEVKKPVAKEVKKPAGKEVTKPEAKKDPNRKKPTLKAKYADKK
jgi:hypothetical protein